LVQARRSRHGHGRQGGGGRKFSSMQCRFTVPAID
jgi:hypothetical protein